MKCRSCNNEKLRLVLDLGKSPLANNFVSDPKVTDEEFPLGINLCEKCRLVQLIYVVPPQKMFSNYLYVTSTTKTFREHFGKMAEDISDDFELGSNSLVVDIGSNDGLLLKGFAAAGCKVLGVEPASNIAMMAEEAGVPTINDFFSEQVAEKIAKEHGKADVIAATNVFAHVSDIHDFTKNVKHILNKDGIFVIEIQYFFDTMEQMTFDNIYHEHLTFYTLTSLKNFFASEGMEIFDVKHVDSHGGSLRVFTQRHGSANKIKSSVNELLAIEEEKGVDELGPYTEFANKVSDTKKKIVEYVKDLKNHGKKIAGYGAPAKATTLLNYCELGTDYIEYIVDDNPLKAGLYSPGLHIPVVNSKMLDEKTPDCILILAWNFAPEILGKTKHYAEQGVKFIIPLPKPVIV